MSLEQIEGHNGYVKNTNNNAVLNINKKEILEQLKHTPEDWRFVKCSKKRAFGN